MASQRVTRKMSRQMSVAAEASNAAIRPAPTHAPAPATTTTKTASKKRSIDETEPNMPPTQKKRVKTSIREPKTRKTQAGSTPSSAPSTMPAPAAVATVQTAAEARDASKINQDIVVSIEREEPQDVDTEQIGGAEANEPPQVSEGTQDEDDSDEIPPEEPEKLASAGDAHDPSNDKEAEPEEGGRRLRSSRLKTHDREEASTIAKPSKKRKAAAIVDSSRSNEDGEPGPKKKKKIGRPPGMGNPKVTLSIEAVRKFADQFIGEPARYDDSIGKMGPVQVRSFEDWVKLQPVFEPEPAAYRVDLAVKGKEATAARKKAKATHDKWVKQREDGPQPIVEHYKISPECDQRRLQASLDRTARKLRKKGAKGDYHPEIANNRLPGNDDVVSPINAYQDLWIVRQAFDLEHENTVWIFTNPKPGLPLPNNIQCGVGDVKARMKDILKHKLLEKVEVEPESENGLAALEMVRTWAMRQGGGGYTLGEETYREWNALYPKDYVSVQGDWRAEEVLKKWGEEGAPV